MRYRSLITPVLILAFLLIALVFRWHTEAQKTGTETGGTPYVIKWNRDQWTREVHTMVYYINKDGSGVHDRSEESIRNNSNIATSIWFLIALVTSIWLLIVV